MSNDNLPPLPRLARTQRELKDIAEYGAACYAAGQRDAVAAIETDRDEWKRIATQAIDSNAELTADAVAASGAGVDDVLHAAQSRMWTALDKKACPGVWMQIASDAILNFKTDSYGGDIAAAPTPDRATKEEAAVPDLSESQMDAAIEAYDKAWNPGNRGRENKAHALQAAFRAFGSPAQPAPVAAPAEAVTDAERLDFLDGNAKFRMGWDVAAAPAGNLRVQAIITGGKPIREAIDAAILAKSKGEGVQLDIAIDEAIAAIPAKGK